MTRSLLAALAATSLLAACSSDDSTPTPSPLTCAAYCASMAATCTAGDVQYTGLTGTCDSYCGTTNSWPLGTQGDLSGNTLACRVSHVGLAAGATGATRTLHCGHAGPSGGDACGTWCQNYCFLALKNCVAHLGTGTDQMGFTDLTTCLAACDPPAPDFPTTGTINGAGNNVQCRIYHAGAAGSAAIPHCAHAAVTSRNTFPSTAVGPCGP